jgi:hypothetical protein
MSQLDGNRGNAEAKKNLEELLQASQPYLNIIQTGAAVAALLLGSAGATYLARRPNPYPDAKAVVRLYPHLRSVGGFLENPIVKFTVSPYNQFSADKALIFQGRNKEGKTTLLRTSIPRLRRWPIIGYYGIYLNGAQGLGVDSFEKWQTTQMFGIAATGGSEIAQCLTQYRESQRLRLFTEAVFGLPGPKPAVVIVDQFEELLMRFPVQALAWANTLTNLHVRDQVARVVFVVNSDNGAQTLLNLNQGIRFHKVVLDPSDHVGKGMEAKTYETCQKNIGLYKMVVREGLRDDALCSFVEKAFARWRQDYQLPFPVKYDCSWAELPPPEMKDTMKKVLELALRNTPGTDGKHQYSDEDVKESMGFAVKAWKYLHPSQILDASAELWVHLLQSAGAEAAVAMALAREIKRIVGNPVP